MEIHHAMMGVGEIQKALKAKGYAFFTKGTYNLNIIGIRDNISNSVDKFNDSLMVIYKDINSIFRAESFAITTKPGLYWMQNFEYFNPDGVAILVPGQYRKAFKIGVFNGEYEALIQNGLLKIYRDGNKDERFDYAESSIIEGNWMQICVHRSVPFGAAEEVWQWSAGCQVFKDSKDFERFMMLCKQSAQTFGDEFTYTLLNKTDFL